MKARALEEAKIELEEAIEFYHKESDELGERFKRAVNQALVKALDDPNRWPRISGEYRRCRVLGFRYGVVYRFNAEELVVIAYMHLHRDPEYWKARDPRGRG
ncbi:MAG TPA: type II toxin-antitoxin system RelE/ParE family toxin [Tepidisphaeraceae bacterium]|jgi:mRNA-degrading endonuclease RelE of RelBE toxin-antitoxin system|nr:type II toxin-antitoxin system RelE/ParE family toxin [Tepidisphaeraceae bacterium]